MEHYTLHFDGSCWPNPGGTAGYGYALSKDGAVVDSGHGVIGTGPEMSNNLSEFHALWKGLESFWNRFDPNVRPRLQVYGDSNLVIKIMNKHYRARREKLYYPAYEKALDVLRSIRARNVVVEFDWIPRAKNAECDDLSKAHQKVSA